MEANEIRRTCLALLSVSLLFAAMFANAAERCANTSNRLERLTGQAQGGTAVLPGVAGTAGNAVPDGQAISGYLALHCEALSKLPLGTAVRAYDGCANSTAIQ
jgi:hypothetical protein